jgi:hypothetical protein
MLRSVVSTFATFEDLMQPTASPARNSVTKLAVINWVGLLLLCSLMNAQTPMEPNSNSVFTSYTVQSGSSAMLSITTDPTPSTGRRPARSDEHLSHAVQLTGQIEERIWRLDRFAQPIA